MDESHVWERGWEDHEQKQLERLAKLSFAEKLDWLEEAQRLVEQMRAEAHPDAPRSSTSLTGTEGGR